MTLADPHEQLAENLRRHCVGADNPAPTIVATGRFPPNWVSTYLSLLNKVENVWGEKYMIPRGVALSLHYVSLHIVSYYEMWCSLNGQRDAKIDADVRRIRSETEIFLLRDRS